ncbi:hypothetical protein ACLOJK_030687 [Asimina triloba]
MRVEHPSGPPWSRSSVWVICGLLLAIDQVGPMMLMGSSPIAAAFIEDDGFLLPDEVHAPERVIWRGIVGRRDGVHTVQCAWNTIDGWMDAKEKDDGCELAAIDPLI